MKKLTTAKIWQFAAGQFGWALLSGIISNCLVYFYQPDETAISQGQTVFIPQGLVIFGVFTIIGGITAFGRIFDAFTDPMIASWSDRCTSKNGRRIPFLKGASLPLALSTVLVFWSPANENSWINAAFLFVMILAYYLSITAYCTPYNALIPELGHTQQERLNISTIISFTFIAGTAVAYLAPTIWGALIPSFGRVNAIRVTFTAMALAAFVCMLVPVFCIREKDYVDTVPSKDSAFRSLAATFRNGEFRKFVGSDIFYWIALTMFQTGLPFFRYQPAETPGDDDNAVLCGNDGTVARLLHSGQQTDTETGQEKDDSVCLCCFQPCIFLHRFYGKHPVHSGSRTGSDSDSRGSTSHGDFRYFAAGGCRRYCTERCGYLGKQPRGNVLRSQNFRLQAGAEPFHADLYGGLHHWKRQWSRIPDCGIRCSCILRRRRTDTDVLR